MLCEATEDDLYVSNISPLGVPFNNLRGNTKDIEKEEYIKNNTPGNPCPKKYAALSNEFGEPTLCTASRKFQRLKIQELDSKQLDKEEYKQELEKITVKSCICVGLGTSALLVNNLDTRVEKTGVSICPGPNMAYFSREMSLKEMVDHIYGKMNVILRKDRPHMFIKELGIYVEYLKNKIDETSQPWSEKQEEYFTTFSENLGKGIEYYKELFSSVKVNFSEKKAKLMAELEKYETQLNKLQVPSPTV